MIFKLLLFVCVLRLCALSQIASPEVYDGNDSGGISFVGDPVGKSGSNGFIQGKEEDGSGETPTPTTLPPFTTAEPSPSSSTTTTTTLPPETTTESTPSSTTIGSTTTTSSFVNVMRQIDAIKTQAGLISGEIKEFDYCVIQVRELIDQDFWKNMFQYELFAIGENLIETFEELFEQYHKVEYKIPESLNRMLMSMSYILKKMLSYWQFNQEPSKIKAQRVIETFFGENPDNKVWKDMKFSGERFDVWLSIPPRTVTGLFTFNEISEYYPAIYNNQPLFFANYSSIYVGPEKEYGFPRFRFYISNKEQNRNISLAEFRISEKDYSGTFEPVWNDSTNITEEYIECRLYNVYDIFTIIKTDSPTPTSTPTPTPTAPPPGEVITDTDDKLQNLTDTLAPSITEEEFEQSLDQTVDLLVNVTQPGVIEAMKPEEAQKITVNTFDIVNNLLSQNDVWNNISPDSQLASSDKLFNITHSLARIMNAKVQGHFEHRNQTVFSRTQQFSLKNEFSIKFDILHEEFPIEVEIPFGSLDSKFFDVTKEHVNATFTAFLGQPRKDFLRIDDSIVNAHIFALVLDEQSVLVDEFSFIIHHYERLEFGDSAKCSFWANTKEWSQHGCRLSELDSDRRKSVCYCDHTTNFAAIMDITHREMPSNVKSVLTYVCSSITVITTVIAMFLSFKYHVPPKQLEKDPLRFRQNKYYINQNICVWLIISHFIIMFGMDQTEVRIVCLFSSILLFFALLCTFTFLLMMSLLLFHSTSHRFLFLSATIRKFSIIGYVFPMVMIGLSIMVIFWSETRDLADALSGEYFCWISSKRYPNNIYFFVVPVTIITIVNFVLMGIVSVRALSMTPLKKPTIRQTLITLTIFALSFGLPWLLFVFYINRYFSSFAYIFILINGSQGIALFAEQFLRYRQRLINDYPSLKRLRIKKKSVKENSNQTNSSSFDFSDDTANQSRDTQLSD